MIHYLFSAFILGYIVAIPPGAVTVAAGQYCLQFGFRKALIFTLGSCISDIFYLTIVYIGFAKFFSSNTCLQIILYIISTALLLYMGINAIRFPIIKNNTSSSSNFFTYKTHLLFSGITITLSNPVTIVGWLAIAGNFFIFWQSAYPPSLYNGVISIIAIMSGVITWFIPLVFFISKLHKLLNNNTIKYIITISGFILAGLGLASGIKLAILVKSLI